MDWIDTIIREPEIDKEVLCTDGDRIWIGCRVTPELQEIYNNDYVEIYWGCTDNCNYTWDTCSCFSYKCLYWMPLPNLPKEQ